MIDAWHLVWIIPVVASVCFCFGVWLATGDDPTKQESTKWDESMCANCPYRPYGNDETTLQ